MPVEEAIDRILHAVAPLPAHNVPVREALGMVLAAPLIAQYTHPAWRNSAMDGYAVHSRCIAGANNATPISLIVDGTIAAGDAPPARVATDRAWRIMTGAPVPDAFDTVLRVEDTDAGIAQVRIHSDRDAHRNVRPRGEDFEKGDQLLPQGLALKPSHIGLAAANGRRTLTVVPRPRVAILGSGNELVDVDQFDDVLAGRRIINSNGYTLSAAVADAGGTPIDLGVAADDPAAIADCILAAPPFDALITCGGISVGAFDYTRDVVQRLGATLDFWRVRMRPGGPFGFGMLAERPWFGLPGNPGSAIVTFEVFVRQALRRMAGHHASQRFAKVELAEAVSTNGNLTHFLRVHVDRDGVARQTGNQGSGRMSAMVHANALLVVPHDVETIAAGQIASALLLDGSLTNPSGGSCRF
jgi:molybdopterin molybdotransferase